MRIIITVDPEIPVPPKYYGGIERIVDMLARGLVARRHHVTLFARKDSTVPCEVVGWHGSRSRSKWDTWRNLRQLQSHVAAESATDLLIHSFARLIYLLPLMRTHIPKIQSYQREISSRSVRWGNRLAGRTLTFTACSRQLTKPTESIVDWRVIPNGVPLDRYQFRPTVVADAPLVFLGRLERIKGPQHAISIAKATGRRLILAGNIPTGGPEADFVQREVLAHCDGNRISYLGPVDDEGKNALLGTAAALLFPVEWEEPFGIVMAESLACGTPVLGLARGSVPEVIQDGRNGFVRPDVAGLTEAVAKLSTLSRESCRRSVEENFSADVIVEQYLKLYREAVEAR